MIRQAFTDGSEQALRDAKEVLEKEANSSLSSAELWEKLLEKRASYFSSTFQADPLKAFRVKFTKSLDKPKNLVTNNIGKQISPQRGSVGTSPGSFTTPAKGTR